jgi:chromosome segregation ATPase
MIGDGVMFQIGKRFGNRVFEWKWMAKLLHAGTEKLDVANHNATQTNAMLLHQNQLLAERVQQLATHGTVLLQMVDAIKQPLPDIAAATADIRQAIGAAQNVLQDNLSNLYMAGENTAHNITQSMLQSQAVLQQDLGTLQQAGQTLLAQVTANVGAVVADATQNISQSVNQAQTLIQDNIGNLHMVAEQLLADTTQLTEGLYSQSEQVLEHVVSMANAAGQIDQTLPSLLQQLGTVSGQINTENTGLQNLLAQQQMLNTQSATQTQNWQAQQQQLEQLHGLLQQTASSTMAALQTKQQHYADLLGVSSQLQNHAHALQQNTQNVLQQAGAGEQQLLASVARVSAATEDLAGKLQAVEKLSNVESQLQQAGHMVVQQLTAIEAQANNAALQLQTQTSQLQQGTQTAAIETQRLHEQQNQLRQELLQMGGLATTLQNAVSALRDEQMQTATHAASLRTELQQLHADLTHSLQAVEQGTATHSAHAADMLLQMQTRVGELAGLVGATQNSLTDLAGLDIKQRRTNFFNSTKFIVETLHSLAFDFSRMMQGDIDDKDYKNYQRGDTGIFTKRLLSQRDDDSKNRMRLKYRDDAEFRNYVQRYWRHYEEIINTANNSDDATVLTPLFNSSDVGRLYQFLCQVLGREAVK